MTPDELAVDMGRVAQVIGDLAGVHDLAADTVLDAVRPPRRTGRLASTVAPVVDTTDFQIIAGGSVAPYGPIVHARDPFLTRALNEREEAVVGLYLYHLNHAVNT